MDYDVALDTWIGRTEKPPADVVSPRLAACFDATIGNTLANVEGASAGLHWCLAPPAAHPDTLGEDGHPSKGGFLPPIPLPRRMWAGGSVEFLSSLHIGDLVQKTSEIKSIVGKEGKTGPLCFVTLANEYATEQGIAIREEQNIVYREGLAGPPKDIVPNPCSIVFDKEARVDVDTVRLFRYSALTFNAHRIHYDLPYAIDVEFHPDLVIHGPLQATFLLNFAIKMQGFIPKSFTYRSVAPATGVQTLRLGYWQTGDNECALSIVSADGRETMTGSASW